MRLSAYSYVAVRIACSKCGRKGSYRLARLADRYGSEATMPSVLAQLAGDCRQRDIRFEFSNSRGAFFPDIGTRPPDEPVRGRTADPVRGGLRLVASVAWLAVFSAVSPALAWGDEGHRIVALIARRLMTPAAIAKADELLGASGPPAAEFARAANWADHWRIFHRATASWHYVDIEIDAPDPAAALTAACRGAPASASPAQDCIVDKINDFAADLGAPSTPPVERAGALKFLLHFLGDLHQPLYAADHRDRGGNCVRIALDGSRTLSLHAYWDTAVVEAIGADAEAVAASLQAKISSIETDAWGRGSARDWALETLAVAKATAYTLGSPPGCGGDAAPIILTEAYRARAQATATTQLSKAGVRLAAVLDRLLDPPK